MNLRRSAAAIVAALLLAGCGGGGSAPTPASGIPAPGASSSSLPAAIAHGTITIKYPATFHRAKIVQAAQASAAASKSKFALRKRPAYVNSQSGYYLDVWVNGVHVIDPSDADSGNVNSGGDGSQTFTLPLYSTQAQQIVAIETDYGIYGGSVLAIGESDIQANTFSAGQAPVFGLTMLMNAVGIGITSDPAAGSDAETCVFNQCGESNYFQFTPANEEVCSTGDSSPTLYTFTTDPEGGFVSAAGAGVVFPSLTSWASINPSNSGNTVSSGTGLIPGLTVRYNTLGTSAVVLNLSATNPASAIYNDFSFDGGYLYPGIFSLVQANGSVSNLLNNTIGEWQNAYNDDVFTMQIEVDWACAG